MQELIYTALVPHPPILIPAVGGKESARVKTTFEAMERVAAEVVALKPDAIVIISPHGPVFQDAIAVHMIPEIKGDLRAFGAAEVDFTVPIDQDLAALVIDCARQAGITVAPVTEEWAEAWDAESLDHGTVVPLNFLIAAGYQGPILPIAMGMLQPLQLYAFGQALQLAIDRHDRSIAVLASGDLSHRLAPGAPAGYHPQSREFDREVVEALGRGDLQRLFKLDPQKVEQAGECGLRPLMMLAGTLDGIAVNPEVLSYESPFGVGYAVVRMCPGHMDISRQLLPRLSQERHEAIARRRAESHPVVRIAREALEQFVRTGMELDFSEGAPHHGTHKWELPPGVTEPAGVFVSLKIDGALRGCMGTTEATQPALALEIVRNAVMAGTEDPRFPPVEENELADLDYSVDILGEAEPCTLADLDPSKYGVIVAKGAQRGLLLPDLPGVDDAEEQVRIAASKAGLEPDDPGVELFRFRVTRYY